MAKNVQSDYVEQGPENGGSFRLLWAFIYSQLKTPLPHFSFWAYLLVAVLGAGALGFWVELVRFWRGDSDTAAVLTAVYTFFPALAAGATLQMSLDERDKKYVISFAHLAGAIVFITTLPRTLNFSGMAVSIVLGVVGTLLATLLWWIANGGNSSFQDFTPTAAVGGDTSSTPEGDISQYNH
ncbi:MAG: hypothetical protein Q8L44_13620 [Sulfuritalea sp.]|nr:hypothetical protein [Sulfuritalea sp.]